RDHLADERAAHAPPTSLGRDGDVEQMDLVDHVPEQDVAEHAAARVAGDPEARPRARELLPELPLPRRPRVAASTADVRRVTRRQIDRDHLVDVALGHRVDHRVAHPDEHGAFRGGAKAPAQNFSNARGWRGSSPTSARKKSSELTMPTATPESSTTTR